ncbi:[Fe-Fe] hydrogenase large subunit C-terminal domain-containing protein [Clostridium sp. DJ247]|uniref:[Fe-Fe] hydrogenase large subunit C-terminal domain-containing protein n=1 Tax=Clostridium sp. DJ247 TaxID=2726188 RepID=UPI001623E0F2|nr:[Fe-Fe] hydrogenase large subunit C-terminal domain-containing protein [Clostridium sp. DJ247]MBC2582816.1 4Fe-4S binding protein [Clostridium sp. DJ247]
MKYMNFSSANCKNCYKCLRSCPVKAIKFKNEQAEVVEDRCIACSNCFSICPQNARHIVSDLGKVKQAIVEGRKVIASIAPSFAGVFDITPGKLAALLRKLGFLYVEETAAGADIVSNLYERYIENSNIDNYISTACPSTNHLIEKYYPSLVKYMIPVVSPMIAHGKSLRQVYGKDSFVVFIGPCIGKKIESESFLNKEIIDAVLTFEEIPLWAGELNIDIDKLEESSFDRNYFKLGKKYPVLGGIVSCISNTLKNKKLQALSISGTEECMELFNSIKKGQVTNCFLEVSACRGSCIGGPSMVKNEKGYYVRLQKIKSYISDIEEKNYSHIYVQDTIEYETSFIDKSVIKKKASEEQITEIMRDMGKYGPEDELNCGVCGYNTCREKAQAVFEGMAETTMCLHYMRSRAESLSNVIFENTLNCIILLDGSMKVKEINPAAEKAFTISAKNIKNKSISLIIEDKDFKYVKETGKGIISKKVSYPKYGLDFIETVVYLPKQDMLLVVMIDITMEEKNKQELMKLKENTINAAQLVIEKQMRVAQEIASLLGETTAETKITLTKLKKIVEGENHSIL